MADTGFIFPGTTIGSRDGGQINWINPDNVKADDGSICDVDFVSAVLSRQLYVSNFGFSSSVPAGATIDGIEVQLGDYDLTSDLVTPWFEVRLVLADNTDGTEDKKSEIADPTSTLNTDQAGGATDLWGETITRTDVIDSDWGWLIKAGFVTSGTGFIQIDFMQMKVFFTAAAAGRIMSSLAYSGGLAHKGGIAGKSGGLAG